MRITADNVSDLTEQAQHDLYKKILGGLNFFETSGGRTLVLETLLAALDEADQDDCFGTEGWRHSFRIED